MNRLAVLIFLLATMLGGTETAWALPIALPASFSTELSELKIKMIYANRDSFLKPCTTASTVCGLSTIEINAVNDVLSRSPQFMGLDVASAKESPTLFTKDPSGQFPLYSSSGNLGSHIILNRDRLVEAPFKPGASFNIFVESVLSYLFFQQTQQVVSSDQIAKKIAAFWGQLFKSYGLVEFKEDKIELLVFKHAEVRFLLMDSVQSYVLNPYLLKDLKCDSGFLASVITNFSVLSWTKYQADFLGSKAGLHTIIYYQCVNAKSETQNWTADLNVDLDFQGTQKKLWNPAKILVNVLGAKKELVR